MSEYGLTDAGWVAPRMSTILEIIRAEYEAEAGYEVDWESDTFLGPITTVMAKRVFELGGSTQEVYDQRDLNNARGLQLANLCLLVNVRPQEATASEVELEIEGDSGTTVPADKVVESDDGTRWELVEATDVGDTGLFRATEAGRIVAPEAETTWKIVTPVDGWDDVVQTDDASPGRDRETDSELRRRRQESLQLGTTTTLPGIRAAVLSLETTEAVTVLDNPSIDEDEVEGFTLPPKSFAVVVYPGSLTSDQQTELVETIYTVAPVGIEMVGDIEEEVVGGDGHEKTVRYYEAIEADVDVEVTVEIGSDYVFSDVEEEVEDVVADYFATLSVGQDVRRLPLYALIHNIDGVRSAEIDLDGEDSDIEIHATEVAIVASTTVTE